MMNINEFGLLRLSILYFVILSGIWLGGVSADIPGLYECLSLAFIPQWSRLNIMEICIGVASVIVAYNSLSICNENKPLKFV
jgi:hypothetical protein